jgi:hypothetical protein
MRPRSFRLPDLSGLDDRLTENHLLSLMLSVPGFPSGVAQQLVTGLVRCTEGALRRYEDARLRLQRSAAQDSLTEYLRGTLEMELTFMALNRSMRLAEKLPGKSLCLPSTADRTLLRRMRNAIEHAEGQIAHAGKGKAIRLDVQCVDSTISDGTEVFTVAHDRFAAWLRGLHGLCVGLTSRSREW